MDKILRTDYDQTLSCYNTLMSIRSGPFHLRIHTKMAVARLNCVDFRKMLKTISWALMSDSAFMDACNMFIRWLQTEDPDLRLTDRERRSKLKAIQDVIKKRGLTYGTDGK